MANRSLQGMFVVVEVQAGVAVSAQCFSDIVAAEKYATYLRSHFDPNDDDVQIFESTIDHVE